MRKALLAILILLALAAVVAMWPGGNAQAAPSGDSAVSAPSAQGPKENCTNAGCHEGIEDIRDPNSDMMRQIKAIGECTACHGGNPDATTAEEAHGPKGSFYPDPGNPWIVDKTCGKCHPGYGYSVRLSLMNTEAGKIQGNLWAWGVKGKYGEGRQTKFANYTLDDTDGLTPYFGTDTYKKYMETLIKAYPDQFPTHVEAMPLPTVEEIVKDPSLAAFTYQRNQCQRCHVGGPPRLKRGDYRGTGCSACHIPYSNEGFYEGNDPTIPKDEPGHLLVHRIQATRDAKVKVHDTEYSGIPVETCNSCHNRGKRIGVSYEGIMEFPYGTPFNEKGGMQPKLHTKKYLFIKDDLHHEVQSRPENPEGGMLCQDCHTSIDMHGDGNLFGTTLAQVEVECADCHGTPDAYPWELPLGYGDELLNPDEMGDLAKGPRGTVNILPNNLTYGTVYDPEDGYLLTARGNPFGNVVRRGDEVILHSASGLDFKVPLLKKIKEEGTWKSKDAEVAMDKVSTHMDNMECYACHADWAPQCYGCHVSVDYSGDKKGTDWLAIGHKYKDTGEVDRSLVIPGKVKEGRGYLRWEDPILGINGEGRVTPLIPGCQVVYTVIGPNGENLAHNVIGRTPPNEEGAGPEGQRGMDMAPVQPHTAGRKARTCESCHSDPKALGYGIQGGKFLKGYTEARVVDLQTATGEVIPAKVQNQMEAIPDLPMDWSQIVDPKTGKQMMTVGSHWPKSGPLTEDQRDRMERVGVCMGCHQNMADPDFWTDQVIATYGRVKTDEEHIKVMNQLVHDAVAGKKAIAEAETAKAKVSQLESKLAEAEMKAKKAAEEAAKQKKAAEEKGKTEAPAPTPTPAPESGGLPWVYILISLVAGLVVGVGVAFGLRKG